MSRPSAALQAVLDEVKGRPSDEPVTWGWLEQVLECAVRQQEDTEWQDSMGDDL